MSRDITITFEDGSTHVYKGAPDTITPEIVQKRAEAQFGKSVTGIDGGRKSGPPPDEGFLTTVRKGIQDAVEPVLSVGANMIMAPIANFAGAAGDIYSRATGTANIGADVQRDVQGLAFQPRTERGQERLAAVGEAFDKSKLAGLPMADLSALSPISQSAKAIRQQVPLIKANSSISTTDMRQSTKPAAMAVEQAAAEQAAIESGNMGAVLDNLKLARENKFVVNPTTNNPILKNKAGSAIVGDSDLNVGAYRINQPNANAKARADLGIAEGTPLNAEAYSGVKQGFIDVSNEVQKIPKFKTDNQYLNSLNERSFITSLPMEEQVLLKNSKQVNKLIEQAALPEFTGTGAIAIMRELRAKSSRVLNNPTADPAATALANAQRNVAKQIEAMIERNLSASGKPELAKRFADERTLYAKASAYQNATTKNGDVQVTKLHSGKGHTAYTGNLKILSDLGEAFPEVFKPPASSGSGLNLTFGGRLNTALDILSTPLKNKMLSEGYQAKNASPPDLRPPVAVPPAPTSRVVPINKTLYDSRNLPQLDAPVIPGSWREGMQPKQQAGMLPVLSEDLLPMVDRYTGTNVPIGRVEGGMLTPKETPLPIIPREGRGMLSLADDQPIQRASPQVESVDFPSRLDVMNTPVMKKAVASFIDEAESIKSAISTETNGFKRSALEARLRGVENRFMAGLKQMGIRNESEARNLMRKVYETGGETQRGIEKVFTPMRAGAQP
jgi:hypothetical protein